VTTDDIVAIQQLMAFCHHAVDHAVDGGNRDLLRLAFTEDARFDTRLCGGPLFEGIDDIIALFSEGRPPHPPSHHMTNCWVREVDGRVLVKMKWLVPDPESGRFYGGDNDDWVVRTADGWRIKERIVSNRYPGGSTAPATLPV